MINAFVTCVVVEGFGQVQRSVPVPEDQFGTFGRVHVDREWFTAVAKVNEDGDIWSITMAHGGGEDEAFFNAAQAAITNN